MNWKTALEKLKKGNESYCADNLSSNRAKKEQRNSLVSGQQPFAIILSCADSRVAPEQIFDADLGELFVIRVAGNVANTSSIASIEYAVAHLKTELIIVLGHESCGAVGATLQGGDNGYNLNHLLSHIVPAVNQSNDSDVNTVVKKNAEINAQSLKERSKIIEDAVNNGQCKIIPAYYALSDGSVSFFE